MFPNIETAMFPGRPIEKKDGRKGFIVRVTSSGTIEAKFVGSDTVETLR